MIYTFKINIFLVALLLVILPSFSIQDNVTNNNNTVNNNPTIGGASPIFNTEINPKIITHTHSVINAIGVKISDITFIISEKIRETVTAKNYEILKQCIKQILWENRYKIVGGTLLGSYSATSLLLMTDYHALNYTLFWTRWKQDYTFEKLCAIPQKELARELMLAIGQHHYNNTNPTDLAYPLITFIKDIDMEIKTIKRYITTTKIIKNLYLMPLFPTNEKKLNRATKMLERALFIKHIFLSWLADYNLASAEKQHG